MKKPFARLFLNTSRKAKQAKSGGVPNVLTRRQFGFPPKLDDFFGDLTIAQTPPWNYELWVEEWAESYLGTAQFDLLQSRFASVSGVEKVVHDDREVFLIKSELDAGILKQKLWQQFLEAAAGSK